MNCEQKYNAALRLLVYGSAADSSDEYILIFESTALECIINYARVVAVCFGENYLWSPTE